MIAFGGWLGGKSRVPSWMRGVWKWPLGNNLSPEVVNLQGWTAVLVGGGALVALVPLLRLPDGGAISRAGVAAAVLFLLVGVVGYVRSIALSYAAPEPPAGLTSTTAIRRENAHA